MTVVAGELLLQRLLVVNDYGTVVCNPDLGRRQCKKMTGASCIGCEHFDALRMKLWNLEDHSQPKTSLTRLSTMGAAVCVPQGDNEDMCRQRSDKLCQRCAHFKEIRQKLFNLEAAGVVAMIDDLSAAGSSLVWHSASRNPPKDDKPKLLHVWGYPVQFVEATYSAKKENWTWLAGDSGTPISDDASIVAWTELPKPPAQVGDSHIEDKFF